MLYTGACRIFIRGDGKPKRPTHTEKAPIRRKKEQKGPAGHIEKNGGDFLGGGGERLLLPHPSDDVIGVCVCATVHGWDCVISKNNTWLYI